MNPIHTHTCHPMRGDELGQVLACCEDDSGCALLVNLCAKVGGISEHSATWSTRSTRQCMWRLWEVLPCAAWKFLDHGCVTVILM